VNFFKFAWFLDDAIKLRPVCVVSSVAMSSPTSEEALIEAVLRVRASGRAETAAQVLALLQAENAELTLSQVKKACSKAVKRQPKVASTEAKEVAPSSNENKSTEGKSVSGKPRKKGTPSTQGTRKAQAPWDAGRFPLHFYAYAFATEGDTHMLQRLLQEQPGVDINARSPPETGVSWTPLLSAVNQMYAGCVQLLLDAGASVDEADPKDGMTPLMHACRLGDAHSVRLLLAAGASQQHEARLFDKQLTPLMLARQFEQPHIVQLLAGAPMGCRVVLDNVTSRPDLNGTEGVVIAPRDEDGERWVIELDGGRGRVSVSRQKFEPVVVDYDRAPCWACGKPQSESITKFLSCSLCVEEELEGTRFCSEECQKVSWPLHKTWHKEQKARRDTYAPFKCTDGATSGMIARLKQDEEMAGACGDIIELAFVRSMRQGVEFNWNGAAKTLQKALRKYPNSSKLLLSLGEIHASAGQYVNSATTFLKVMEISSADSGPWAHAAMRLLNVVKSPDSGKYCELVQIPEWLHDPHQQLRVSSIALSNPGTSTGNSHTSAFEIAAKAHMKLGNFAAAADSYKHAANMPGLHGGIRQGLLAMEKRCRFTDGGPVTDEVLEDMFGNVDLKEAGNRMGQPMDEGCAQM